MKLEGNMHPATRSASVQTLSLAKQSQQLATQSGDSKILVSFSPRVQGPPKKGFQGPNTIMLMVLFSIYLKAPVAEPFCAQSSVFTSAWTSRGKDTVVFPPMLKDSYTFRNFMRGCWPPHEGSMTIKYDPHRVL